MSSLEIVDEPAVGRVFERTLMPGIADAVESGRIRLDALTRWLQDVAYADVVDAGFEQRGIWIVRRMRLRVRAFPRFGELATLRTFCSGIGRFSAERTTMVTGATGRVEAAAIWVWINEAGRPGRFPERFQAIYEPSARDRPAPTRLHRDAPPEHADRRPWMFRAADVDVAGHINNAQYWAVVEQELAGREPEAIDVEIEHREEAQPGPANVIRDGSAVWIESESRAVHAALRFAEPHPW